MTSVLAWILFNIFVLILLAVDLGIFHRKAHEMKIREALLLSLFWIVIALLFNLGVYIFMGSQQALEFFTGYVIEKSLSVDNLFVFLMIFSYFRVPAQFQHKILYYGILGALVMRAVFILSGIALIERFHWIIYIFGAFLIFTGFKMAFQKEKEVHPEKNPVLRLLKKLMPVSIGYEDGKFIRKLDGKFYASSLLVVLVVIETTDLVFAVDSIPAILAITRNSFIVYTSNVFAILGLRALYFALAGMVELFHYLNYGLAVILSFVGVKMLISDYFKIPTPIALGVIAGILLVSMLASVAWPKKEK